MALSLIVTPWITFAIEVAKSNCNNKMESVKPILYINLLTFFRSMVDFVIVFS